MMYVPWAQLAITCPPGAPLDIWSFSEDHLHMLTQIFNVVLLSGHIPQYWLFGIIKLMYKNMVTLLTRTMTEG